MPRVWPLLIAMLALHAPVRVVAHADPLEGALGGNDQPPTRAELALLDALKRNRPEDTETQTRPVVALDNTVQFVFGMPDPTAICTPFEGCDLRLEPGELVREASMADRRWQVDILFEGEAPNEVPHVVIYPHDIGLAAKLIIPTNRRTYHINLISRSASENAATTPKIAFLYPEDIHSRFASARAWQQHARVANQTRTPPSQPTAAPTKHSIASVVFAYSLTGRAPWKPLRVFNDGAITLIDFPSAVRHTELPSLLVVRSDGDLLHEEELVMVNTDYDPEKRRMTVYSVFDRAYLIAGVGHNKVSVEITRLPSTR
jgi:type IV secretion system protein VirB9